MAAARCELDRVPSLRGRSYRLRWLRDFRRDRMPRPEVRTPWPKAWRRPAVPGAKEKRRDPSRHTRFRRRKQSPETSRHLRDGVPRTSACRLGLFPAFSREEQDALWKLRAQFGESAKQEHVPFFRHEGRNIAEAHAFLRNRETSARARRDPLAKPSPEFPRQRKSLRRGPKASRLPSTDFSTKSDTATTRPAARYRAMEIESERQREFHTARDNQGNEAVRPRQPCGGERVRFVGMDDIHSTASHQPAGSPERRQGAGVIWGTLMDDDARFLRTASQQRISKCDQFRSVAALEQTPQQQKRLVLPATEIPAEVDNQRAHAQASPGFGHDRSVSFSPVSSRPSFRYLM